VQITTLPGRGALLLAGLAVTVGQEIPAGDLTAGSLRFVPAADQNGAPYTTFQFKVHDGTTYSAAAATLTVNVTPVNDPPTAANSTVTTLEGFPYTFAPADFRFADADQGDSLSKVRITALPAAGTLRIGAINVTAPAEIAASDLAAGSLRFYPVAGQNGAPYATFPFQVHDGTVYSAVYTLTINVTPVNSPPMAAGDALSTAEDLPLVLPAGRLTGNDSPGPADESGQSLTIVPGMFGAPANGTVTFDGTVVTYLPNADFYGLDTFTYTVDDGDPASTAVGTVTVTVTPVNDPPALGADAYSVLDNAALGGATGAPVTGLLTNDRDPDGDALTLLADGTAQPSRYGAVVKVLADGQFTYDPRRAPVLRGLVAGQSIDDTFTYQVRDSQGALSTGTVTVTVDGITDPPLQNPVSRYDVSDDGILTALDVLVVINFINENGSGRLRLDVPGLPYLDVNGDDNATAVDVLTAIDELNRRSAVGAAEGEGEAVADGSRSPETSGVRAEIRILTNSATKPLAALGVPLIVDQGVAVPAVAAAADPVAGVPRSQAAPAARRSAVFDDLDVEQFDLEDVLADIASDTDATANAAATDRVFAWL
jgi:VCBS repeat-containing protein